RRGSDHWQGPSRRHRCEDRAGRRHRHHLSAGARPISENLHRMTADDRIIRWRRDPVAFVKEVFGPGYEAETGEKFELDQWQEDALRLLMPHPPHENCDGSPANRIAVRAAKGPGKSALDSWIVWWFETTRPYANI